MRSHDGGRYSWAVSRRWLSVVDPCPAGHGDLAYVSHKIPQPEQKPQAYSASSKVWRSRIFSSSASSSPRSRLQASRPRTATSVFG